VASRTGGTLFFISTVQSNTLLLPRRTQITSKPIVNRVTELNHQHTVLYKYNHPPPSLPKRHSNEQREYSIYLVITSFWTATDKEKRKFDKSEKKGVLNKDKDRMRKGQRW
jgi:hypothetical protein